MVPVGTTKLVLGAVVFGPTLMVPSTIRAVATSTEIVFGLKTGAWAIEALSGP